MAKPELKENNLKIFNEVREFADRLNVDYIIIHGGLDGDVNETAKQLKSFNEPRALIENKPYRAVPKIAENKTCIGYNFNQLEIIKNESDCGFCLDFNHAICTANSFNYNYVNFIKELMKLKPNMFHISDMENASAEIDTHLHLGAGQINLQSLTQFLNKDSKVSLETAKSSKTSLEDFIKDSEYFSKMLIKS